MWSRRRALGALASVGLVAACKDDGHTGDGGTTADAGTTGATGTSSGPPISDDTTTSSDGTGSDTGPVGPTMSDCEADGGLDFAELMAPIDHIVVLMMENRSFDHMFGSLKASEGRTIDGLSGTETNPSPRGGDVVVHPLTDTVVAVDPDHGWDGSRAQWNMGANDGFVTSYAERGAADPGEVMGYYERASLPVSYALADTYSICDRWFSSVMGPTWPNRFHLHLGTSYGMKSNDGVTDVTSIWDKLDEAGVTNMYYSSNVPFTLTFGKTRGVEQLAEFFAAAAEGTLPQFVMVEPAFTDFAIDPLLGNDDHPPADVSMGQAFIASIYAAIAQSPLWDRTLLILTYDEHGGFYDHVSPPQTTDDDPEFRQLGFRVPAVVIGPYVKRGCVTSTVFDHVSVVSTVTRKWNLEPLNTRVEATSDLSSCIDPSFLDDPQPPVALSRMIVRRPRPSGTKIQGEAHTELFAAAERHGLDPARRHAAAEASIEAMLTWGERLGVLQVVDSTPDAPE